MRIRLESGCSWCLRAVGGNFRCRKILLSSLLLTCFLSEAENSSGFLSEGLKFKQASFFATFEFHSFWFKFVLFPDLNSIYSLLYENLFKPVGYF